MHSELNTARTVSQILLIGIFSDLVPLWLILITNRWENIPKAEATVLSLGCLPVPVIRPLIILVSRLMSLLFPSRT